METTTGNPKMEDLCSIAVFRDLPKDALQWLLEKLVLLDLAPGDIVIRAGEPAEKLFVLFSGEIRGEVENGGQVFTVRGGEVTGLLPYSRLTVFRATARATVPSRGAFLHKDHFPEMLRNIPVLQERLVGVMVDRIRETTRADQQREKLVALGQLSAGLAHELNNPTAAGQRAAEYLRKAVKDFRVANSTLMRLDVQNDMKNFLIQLENDLAEQTGPPASLDTLERSRREEDLTAWLEKNGVEEAWNIAPDLVDAGCTQQTLEKIRQHIPPEYLSMAFGRLTASLTITKLVDEMSQSMNRIAELVKAIKDYSYMDQMPEQEVDLHTGIENTLIMLKHRMKNGVNLVRDYDRSIPRMSVRGSELNQVWTNLITNAIDAMNGKGNLDIVTRFEKDQAVVKVVDSGAGIPPDIKNRIFEPFFTTKGVNEGTGLGLDIAARVVRNHGGDIRVESQPGHTVFAVRLPLRVYSPDDHATRNSG